MAVTCWSIPLEIPHQTMNEVVLGNCSSINRSYYSPLSSRLASYPVLVPANLSPRTTVGPYRPKNAQVGKSKQTPELLPIPPSPALSRQSNLCGPPPARTAMKNMQLNQQNRNLNPPTPLKNPDTPESCSEEHHLAQGALPRLRNPDPVVASRSLHR